MKPIKHTQLAAVVGGGDPNTQPLTMPPGWSPNQTPGLPSWIRTVSDYLRYLGVVLEQ
jgi:hypothetical protein